MKSKQLAEFINPCFSEHVPLTELQNGTEKETVSKKQYLKECIECRKKRKPYFQEAHLSKRRKTDTLIETQWPKLSWEAVTRMIEDGLQLQGLH